MFYKPNNKIIIVDDIEDHLITLSKVFHEKGIGCKTFQYSIDYDTPLKGVRIAFFDIEINPSGGASESKILNDLAVAIQQYIHKDNGPFALIFWTQKPDFISKFKLHIQHRYKEFPIPFLVAGIDKADFTEQALIDILSDETIELLFDFENVAQESAYDTINEIYHIIPHNDSWGENTEFKQNFEKIFSKISTSILGFNHAKENPDKAVYESLIPVLNYQIASKNIDSKWSNYLISLKTARNINDIQVPVDFKESILNRIFHIDVRRLPFPIDTRGAVIEVTKTEPDFTNYFGVPFETWFTSLLPIKDRRTRRMIRTNSKLVAIEVSSACDFSQNKSRLNKYLLGLLIDPIEKEDIGPQGDCAFKVGEFFIDDVFQVWINLNYVFSARTDDPRFITPMFILKKEIMDMIGNRYANHVSRIGITSF